MFGQLADYYTKGEYCWGEAFAPSLCVKNQTFDCRQVNIFGNRGQGGAKNLANSFKHYDTLKSGGWHHGFDVPAWKRCKWPDGPAGHDGHPVLAQLCPPDVQPVGLVSKTSKRQQAEEVYERAFNTFKAMSSERGGWASLDGREGSAEEATATELREH